MSNVMMAQMLMNQSLNPLMVPAPFPTGLEMPQEQFVQLQQLQPEEPSKEDGYNLYLCKIDFKPFSQEDAEILKQFIVTELLAASENAHGWAPDITLKGLQSQFRYQLHTYDESSKEWLIRLDFSRLNVLLYTKEELWYERAAIWLPGHSRCRHIEPLEKLRLQNKKLEGGDIGKWKLVKKIVNCKGTRIYIDIPPASARALEKHKMLLSYELQKVSVFLKAMAVDKDAFDAGLKEPSVVEQSVITQAVQNSAMPSLPANSDVVKITLKGAKSLTVAQARKIKEIIIYNLFKYHQSYQDTSRTDFVKYGFYSTDCFAVLPENEESRRWISGLNIGRMNRHPIVVVGAEDSSTRYILMTIEVPHPTNYELRPARIIEQLKKCNQGVKGIRFSLWKPEAIVKCVDRRGYLKVDIDLESIETLSKMKFQLDYMDERLQTRTAEFTYKGSVSKLLELVKKYKSEMEDSYDVANMDISQSDSDDDIIFLGNM